MTDIVGWISGTLCRKWVQQDESVLMTKSTLGSIDWHAANSLRDKVKNESGCGLRMYNWTIIIAAAATRSYASKIRTLKNVRPKASTAPVAAPISLPAPQSVDMRKCDCKFRNKLKHKTQIGKCGRWVWCTKRVLQARSWRLRRQVPWIQKCPWTKNEKRKKRWITNECT